MGLAVNRWVLTRRDLRTTLIPERALSDLPQIPAPGRGVSATSQLVREVGSSILSALVSNS